jgi:segregation and condensation protein B
MPPSPERPQPETVSLDALTEAFAQVMGVEPRRAAESAEPPTPEPAAAAPSPAAEPPPQVAEDDACPLTPQSILEAMLFVGNRDSQLIAPRQAAELMRDVATDEIPSLVAELNRRYEAQGAVYHIVGDRDGYRLTLRRQFRPLRDRFYGRVREARLSQAAIDVLALVAYQQPLTGEQIGQLRGKPSNHVLAHLVRRGLLRIERADPKRRTPHYHTTQRFLRLFNLQSLDDLPRSEDGA